MAGQSDAGLWVPVWSKVGECIEEGFFKTFEWYGLRCIPRNRRRPKCLLENRQVAWVNEKADELAKTGAIQDDAEVAQRIAKEAFDTRNKVYAAVRYAATFPDGVEDLADVEEVIQEDKKKPQWLFDFEEAEGRTHRMVRAVEGKSSSSA